MHEIEGDQCIWWKIYRLDNSVSVLINVQENILFSISSYLGRHAMKQIQSLPVDRSWI